MSKTWYWRYLTELPIEPRKIEVIQVILTILLPPFFYLNSFISIKDFQVSVLADQDLKVEPDSQLWLYLTDFFGLRVHTNVIVSGKKGFQEHTMWIIRKPDN